MANWIYKPVYSGEGFDVFSVDGAIITLNADGSAWLKIFDDGNGQADAELPKKLYESFAEANAAYDMFMANRLWTKKVSRDNPVANVNVVSSFGETNIVQLLKYLGAEVVEVDGETWIDVFYDTDDIYYLLNMLIDNGLVKKVITVSERDKM